MKSLSRLELCSKCFDAEQVLRTTAGPGAEDQQLYQISSNGGQSVTSAGTAALHTTTGGRTFYVTDLLVTADAANTSPVLVQLEISGGVVVFEAYVSATSPIDMPGIESQPQSPSNSILAIKWSAVNNQHISWFVAGYEQ